MLALSQSSASPARHLLKKVELETCALHSLLIIALPASTIVHVLWHSQSLHLGFAQDSVDKPDDECGKLLPERVWLGLCLKLLAKDSPVVFCCAQLWAVLFFRGLHDAKQRCSACRWLIIRLTVLNPGLCQLCFDTAQLKICSISSSHSLSLPAVALFSSSKDLLADGWSLTLCEPENLCKSLTKSSLLSLQALLTGRRCFTCVTLNTHVLTADGWVGIFMYSKSVWSHRLVRSVNQKIRQGPFCALKVSRPVSAYIHLSWLGVFKNVVVLH